MYIFANTYMDIGLAIIFFLLKGILETNAFRYVLVVLVVADVLLIVGFLFNINILFIVNSLLIEITIKPEL